MPWRLWAGHLALQLSEPAVGASEDLRGAALVAAVFSDGAARDGPFEVVQEFGERAALFDGIKQGFPFDRKRFLELVSPQDLMISPGPHPRDRQKVKNRQRGIKIDL